MAHFSEQHLRVSKRYSRKTWRRGSIAPAGEVSRGFADSKHYYSISDEKLVTLVFPIACLLDVRDFGIRAFGAWVKTKAFLKRMGRADHVIENGLTWNEHAWRHNVGIKLKDAKLLTEKNLLFRIEGTRDLQLKKLL